MIVCYQYEWIPNAYCGGGMVYVKPSEMYNGQRFSVPFYRVIPICGWRIKKLTKNN